MRSIREIEYGFDDNNKDIGDVVESFSHSYINNAIALGSRSGDIKLFELSKLKCVRTIHAHSDRTNFLSFSPCGKYLLSGDERSLKIWDASSGQLLRVIEGRLLKEIVGYVEGNEKFWSLPGAFYHPNGKYIIIITKKMRPFDIVGLQVDSFEEFNIQLPKPRNIPNDINTKHQIPNERLKNLFTAMLKVSWLSQEWKVEVPAIEVPTGSEKNTSSFFGALKRLFE